MWHLQSKYDFRGGARISKKTENEWKEKALTFFSTRPFVKGDSWYSCSGNLLVIAVQEENINHQTGEIVRGITIYVAEGYVVEHYIPKT